MKTEGGAFQLFAFRGIEVFVHWSWFVVGYFLMERRREAYPSVVWNVAEYLALFVIVLLHEFGHAFACRQTGGIANRIMLWPLGGIAFVQPPPRAGALLWSIAAGPLVNVALAPVLYGLHAVTARSPMTALPDFFWVLFIINGLVLVFNILPVYPLDGGQMLRALLWFAIGRDRSLFVASVIGVIGGLGLLAFAVLDKRLFTGVIAVFLLMQCMRGFKEARMGSRLAKLPRHDAYSCPWCGAAPLQGPYWACNQCGEPFDTFAQTGRCPRCSASFTEIACPECQRQNSRDKWVKGMTKPE